MTERLHFHRVGFPVAQTIKNLPAVQETWIQSLGWEDPLEKGTATHSSILAWSSMDRGAWWAIVHEVARVRQDLTTKLPLMVPVTLKLS